MRNTTTPSAIAFDNSYARLPGQFYAHIAPTPVAQPALIKVNTRLAADLGLDENFLATPKGIDMLAGNHVPDGAEPIAMAYGGHQFGNWVAQLGDGRAVLLGEVLDGQGARFDIQLKGSGRTPYSRGGDGRAWLGPVLREYVLSEAMAALNIPTTRALAAVASGEVVRREQDLPGAVLTRVGKGHIRVGTFEYFAAREDTASLRLLADHVIARFYPDAIGTQSPYLTLLERVVERQAALVAKWMGVGFIHGVMNTDNTSIAGETIDYGPCAFMDAYHPKAVFSSIDTIGRYAYGNQPDIAKWNLTSFASTLIPVLHADGNVAVDMAQQTLDAFDGIFAAAWTATFRAKLGLVRGEDADAALIHDLLSAMAENKLDFTQTFRGLSDGAAMHTALAPWMETWRERLTREGRGLQDIHAAMRAVNPAYIARNHRVEEMIAAAVEGDFDPFERLLAVLAHPFDAQPQWAEFQTPPTSAEIVRETFCGT